MEREILTRCGYRCDLCLAYGENVKKNDRRRELSDGWSAIYGFRVEPEDIVCDGCVSDGRPRLIDKGCPVRPCVNAKGIANCAHCREYICDKLLQRIVSREVLEAKARRTFNPEEYEMFVKPYESKIRLDKLRDGLKKRE
jgi:hypothetical protein